MTTTEPLLEHAFYTPLTYMRSWLAKALDDVNASRRRRATDALSTCIGDDAGLSTIFLDLKAPAADAPSLESVTRAAKAPSIHTHNLRSSWDHGLCSPSWDKVFRGSFLYSMNESTLLTKAVSALVFRRFTTAAAAATSS